MSNKTELPAPGQAPAATANEAHLAKLARDVALAFLLALPAAPVADWLWRALAEPAPAPARACDAQIHALVLGPASRPRCLVRPTGITA